MAEMPGRVQPWPDAPPDLARAPRRISLTLHKFGQGGTDRVCVHLANGFAAAGNDVEIIALCDGGEGAATLLPMIDPRVALTCLGRMSTSRPRDIATHFPAFVRHVRRRAPDCLVSTGNNMNWVTALGLDLAGIAACRLVLKTTNPIVRPGDALVKRGIRRAGYARAFRRADLVLTLSDAETALLRRDFGAIADRFRTVANPYVAPAMLATARWAPPAVPGAARLVLGVGRFGGQKRMDLLLRAVARLRTPNVGVALLGDGPDRAALERLAIDLGLRARVAMPGYVDSVADWFALADVFVLPSVYEGLPAVVVEAMAANCPVIATDCFPAARALVGTAPGCAILDDADPERLAQLIDSALARPRPYALRARARPYAIDAAVTAHLAAIDTLFPATIARQPVACAA